MHILHDEIGAPKFKIKADTKNSAIITINPLPAGFGTTIGNALRRILLSSLPGTAVSAIKIDGASHEYSTIPGLKDSLLDIILNIRLLKLKKHKKGEEIVEVPLKKSGVITAKDLKTSSDIEILDPNQIITTCDGADPKKKIYLRVEKGVGYHLVSNELNSKEKNPEFILVDVNYSPVVHVSYNVTSSRVGEITNLDNLNLEVKTNGTLEAENAIKLAAGILQSYFELFNRDDVYTDLDFTTNFDKIKKQKEEEEIAAAAAATEEVFTPIDILGLSQRTLNALVNGGITSVEQLLVTPMSQLSQFRGFGTKAKNELEQVVIERGYKLCAENNFKN